MIISLRGEDKVHKTNLTPPHFVGMPIPRQESKWSCICVRVSTLTISTIYLLVVGAVQIVW